MENYFSVRYDAPYPEKFIATGSYDVGCGGDIQWYITEEEVDEKFMDFCVSRLKGRYVFIVETWEQNVRDCKIYKYFKKRFPSIIEGADPMYVAFSDSPNIEPAIGFNERGDECGIIYVIDLESGCSTYMFDETTGFPIWQED